MHTTPILLAKPATPAIHGYVRPRRYARFALAILARPS